MESLRMLLATAVLFSGVIFSSALSLPRDHAQAAVSTTVPLTVYGDGYFLLNVSIGTPAQTFRLLLDTASSNLWVIDKACRNPDCVGGAPPVNFTKLQFDGSKSSTYTNLKQAISIVYYDMGAVKGTIVKDKISFAGSLGPQPSFADFAVINQPAPGLAYWPMDGILGLAFPPLADPRTSPPFTKVRDIFSVFLDGNHLPSGSVGGSVTFGSLDNVHCNEADYFYSDLTAQKFWQIPVDQFQIKSYKFGQTQQAFLDSGSFWLAFPPAQLFAIIDATNAEYQLFEGMYTVDCNAKLPEIVLSIRRTLYIIEKEQYTRPVGQGLCQLLINFYDVATADPSAPTTVLGQPFLRKRCVAFDVAKQRVGIAHQKS